MEAIQNFSNLDGLLQKYHLRRIAPNIAKRPRALIQGFKWAVNA
jgi:hypothetical protein